MEIYVQSRGFSREHDYTWVRITEGEPQPIESPFYQQITTRVKSGVFSVVLERWGDRLSLLVAGLKSERKDIAHRPIRNSVIWLSQNFEDEQAFRSLAAKALRSHVSTTSTTKSFDQQIDEVIDKGEIYGFQASLTQLEPQNFVSLKKVEKEAQLEVKSGKICSDDEIHKLAEQLERCYLPKPIQDVSIIVTMTKSKAVPDGNQVWQVLTRLDDSSNAPIVITPLHQLLRELLLKTFFPSIVSIALTTAIFLAPPVRHWLTSPCPQPPNPEAVTFSGQPVMVGASIPLIIRSEDDRIRKFFLIVDANEEKQEVIPGFNGIYNYPGFQTAGKHHLTLQGIDSKGSIIGEETRDYLVGFEQTAPRKQIVSPLGIESPSSK